ncbi:hypothetical protein DERF_001573 [Dermatophagoides farinae]|uniref:Uncharacterized protein n=1 Tax=Dermatophagoides farinae TaxID=6954 RepID=A0A922IDZ7_DERFA|nr:hypothetical protein DERF_001573 [Dermatophagoides farinae]
MSTKQFNRHNMSNICAYLEECSHIQCFIRLTGFVHLFHFIFTLTDLRIQNLEITTLSSSSQI